MVGRSEMWLLIEPEELRTLCSSGDGGEGAMYGVAGDEPAGVDAAMASSEVGINEGGSGSVSERKGRVKVAHAQSHSLLFDVIRFTHLSLPNHIIMARIPRLPDEVFDLVFQQLIRACSPCKLDPYWEERSTIWACYPDHPIKAFGNACSSFRERVQPWIWSEVKVCDARGMIQSSKLMAYLRAIDHRRLSVTREFSYESYRDGMPIGLGRGCGSPLEVLDNSTGAHGGTMSIYADGTSPNCMPLRADGSLDVDYDSPLVDLFDHKALGRVETESDVWAVLRFLFSRLTGVETFTWKSQLDWCLRFSGVSLAESIAALPNRESRGQSDFQGTCHLMLNHFFIPRSEVPASRLRL